MIESILEQLVLAYVGRILGLLQEHANGLSGGLDTTIKSDWVGFSQGSYV